MLFFIKIGELRSEILQNGCCFFLVVCLAGSIALHVPLEHMALRLSAYLIGQVTHRADRLIG